MNFYWEKLSEELKYKIWSAYVYAGGKMDYVSYCEDWENEEN
jgi:hypothetical protein